MKALQRFYGVFLFWGDQTDGANRLISTTYPDGTSDSTSYDSLGHVVGTQDQKGRNTNNFYDAMGRSVSIQYPDGRFVTYGYDQEGHKTSKTTIGSNGAGSQTTFTHFDLLSRADAVTNTDGFSFTRTVYDAQGRAIDTIDELGNDTHTDYDQASRRLDTIAGFGTAQAQETQYSYDNNGNVTTLTVGNVLQSTTSYDSLNRATTVTYQQPLNEPAIQPVITTFDADSRKLSQNDQAGKLTQYGYDGQGHLTGVTLVSSSGNQTESYTYDNLGNMLSQTDSNGHATHFTYDNMNRRVSRTLPDGINSETYGPYDATGNLTKKKTFKGQTISYSYNPLTDKLTGESFAEGSISFNYDGFLRRQSMTDVSGTTTYNYDQRNRLVTKTSPFGTLTYGYDNHSNLTSTTSSNTNGTNVSYAYDTLNRPTTVTDIHRSQNLVTTYNYDPIGNLATVQKPNGEAVTYTYDVLNRLTNITANVGANTIASYAYSLGASGNRTSVNELSGRAVSWTYDDLYHLTGEIISNDPASNNGAIGYTYDPVGNRQQRTSSVSAVPMQNFTGQYDQDDHLAATGYTFDANGSTTTDPNGTYVYDSLGHMTSATVNGVTSTYVYDGDGNKVNETFGSVSTTNYVVDVNNPTGSAQVLEETDTNGNVNKVFTYGASRISQDQLVSSNWSLSFFGTDGQGSVRYLADINGNITDRMDYDAFGILVNRTGSTPNEIFYDGEQLDGNSSFYNLRARWMNPAIGRFQTMDSFDGILEDPLSLHKYIYASNNPINKFDPSGYQDDIASLGITVAIIGVVYESAITTFNAASIISKAGHPNGWIASYRFSKSKFGVSIGAGIDVVYSFNSGQAGFFVTGEIGGDVIGLLTTLLGGGVLTSSSGNNFSLGLVYNMSSLNDFKKFGHSSSLPVGLLLASGAQGLVNSFGGSTFMSGLLNSLSARTIVLGTSSGAAYWQVPFFSTGASFGAGASYSFRTEFAQKDFSDNGSNIDETGGFADPTDVAGSLEQLANSLRNLPLNLQ